MLKCRNVGDGGNQILCAVSPCNPHKESVQVRDVTGGGLTEDPVHTLQSLTSEVDSQEVTENRVEVTSPPTSPHGHAHHVDVHVAVVVVVKDLVIVVLTV